MSNLPSKIKEPPQSGVMTVFLAREDISALITLLSFASSCIDTLINQSTSMGDESALKMYLHRKKSCENIKNYLVELTIAGEPESRDIH